MDCYLCPATENRAVTGNTRVCETCKRPVCPSCARVWYEWRYAQRVTTVAECRPCVNAGLLRAAAEGRALAGDVEPAPSFEELGC
jgi:hypothetical protein